VSPPLAESAPTPLIEATAFLFEGPAPIQTSARRENKRFLLLRR
jgi:hypothetical protein